MRLEWEEKGLGFLQYEAKDGRVEPFWKCKNINSPRSWQLEKLRWKIIFPECIKVALGDVWKDYQQSLWPTDPYGSKLSTHVYLVTQSCLTLCSPMDCSPPGSSVHGDSPDKNTGVGCHALLQGIFPIQWSNPGLPHCRRILYCLSHQGSYLCLTRESEFKQKYHIIFLLLAF